MNALNKYFRVIAKLILQRQTTRAHPLTIEINNLIESQWVISRCVISNQYNYAYFRIPKSANSTIVKTLAYYDQTVDFKDDDISGSMSKKKFKSLLSAHAVNINDFQKKYYLFTFVRNPYTRVLSAYLDKIENNKKSKYENIREIISTLTESGEITFGGFVSYLESGGLYQNPHWTPQVAMIPVRLSRLDFIGKVENIQGDMNSVIDKIFGDKSFHGLQNRKVGKQNASGKLKDFYDTSLTARISSLYSDDFKALGYSVKLNQSS
jgi:dermatan 4-sulfotransferase 1